MSVSVVPVSKVPCRSGHSFCVRLIVVVYEYTYKILTPSIIILRLDSSDHRLGRLRRPIPRWVTWCDGKTTQSLLVRSSLTDTF